MIQTKDIRIRFRKHCERMKAVIGHIVFETRVSSSSFT